MRTEQEMLEIILSFAKENEAIKVVGMEGSRVHPLIEKDDFQDFDITYVVTEMEPFVESEDWLEVFGKRIFMQKPEDMTLYDPQLGNWYSYLMLLEDGNRVDLTIVPIEELDFYLSKESLIKIILDKDNLVGDFPLPTNATYHVRMPSLQNFIDSCNEFWWVSTYVAKGICRKEFLYACDYLNQILRKELFRMISWKVGIETDFSVSVGKSHRFLEKRVSPELWNRIIASYNMNSYENLWKSLFEVQEMFREVSKEVAKELGYPYPDFDENITKYINELHQVHTV